MNSRVNRDSPVFRKVQGHLVGLLAGDWLAEKELLLIFERFPDLATMKYRARFGGLTIDTPLACFLMAGITDAQVIESLCQKMKPEELDATLRQVGYRDRLPLHEACLNSSDAVVEFLLSQKATTPPMLSTPDKFGEFPFDLAMRNPKLSLVTKKKLLELNPAAVGVGNSFKTAVVQSNLDMLQFIAHLWPETNTHFCVKKWEHDPIWTLEVGRIFTQLFPKLTTMSLQNIWWDVPAFKFLLEGLSANKSVETIEGLNIPVTEQADHAESLLFGVQQIFENNDTLKRIGGMGFPSYRGRISDQNLIPLPLALKWLRVMDRGARTSQSLQFLDFNAPIRAREGGCLECNLSHQGTLSTGVTFLALQVRCIGGAFADSKDFLQMLPTLSSLTDVSLEFSLGDVGIQRDRIVALLRSDHHFQRVTLRVGGDTFDVVPVCDALKVNHRLVSFHLHGLRSATSQMTLAFRSMLEKCNTTLTSCVFPGGDDDPRVQHYLYLNRFGRSHVRGPATNQRRSKLVQLLLAARIDSDLQLSGKSQVQSILYGLLLENSTLWACGGADNGCARRTFVDDGGIRKRKEPPS